MKFRFGLDQFGQRTVRGAFRFIVLGLLTFMLAFWEALETVADWALLDWGLVACSAADELVPEIQALEAQRTLDRLRPILETRGSTCQTVFPTWCNFSVNNFVISLHNHSHSIVAGGLLVMSYTTRFTSGTKLTIRFATVSRKSCGNLAQSAVMKSLEVTARNATR